MTTKVRTASKREVQTSSVIANDIQTPTMIARPSCVGCSMQEEGQSVAFKSVSMLTSAKNAKGLTPGLLAQLTQHLKQRK